MKVHVRCSLYFNREPSCVIYNRLGKTVEQFTTKRERSVELFAGFRVPARLKTPARSAEDFVSCVLTPRGYMASTFALFYSENRDEPFQG